MEQGIIARAVFSFDSSMPGELSLRVGDVLQVLRSVDRHWSHGCRDEQFGNFPTGFVMEVPLPSFQSGQQLFVARGAFKAEETQDLPFDKGAVIVGLNEIDANWWNGCLEDRVGIFPLSLVWKVDMNALKVKHNEKGKVSFRARVTMDLKAQLEEEMDLCKDEIVTVIEIIDNDWYRGTCHGRTGIFPSSFVTPEPGAVDSSSSSSSALISPSDLLSFDDSTAAAVHRDSKTMQTPAPAPSIMAPLTQKQPQFATHPQSVCFNNNSSYLNLNSNCGDVTNCIIVTENLNLSPKLSHHSDHQRTDRELARTLPADTPRARTTYPFVGEFSNELSFVAGQTLLLRRRIDDQWLEGELNGQIGLFPACYVEILEDLPNAAPTTTNTITEYVLEEQRSAVALFDFVPQATGDVGIRAGETVKVLDGTGPDWFTVRNARSQVGQCPATYLRLADDDHCDDEDVDSMGSAGFRRQMSLPGWSRSLTQPGKSTVNVTSTATVTTFQATNTITKICASQNNSVANSSSRNTSVIHDTVRNSSIIDGSFRNNSTSGLLSRNNSVLDGSNQNNSAFNSRISRNNSVFGGSSSNNSAFDSSSPNNSVFDSSSQNNSMINGSSRNNSLIDGSNQNNSVFNGSSLSNPVLDGTSRFNSVFSSSGPSNSGLDGSGRISSTFDSSNRNNVTSDNVISSTSSPGTVPVSVDAGANRRMSCPEPPSSQVRRNGPLVGKVAPPRPPPLRRSEPVANGSPVINMTNSDLWRTSSLSSTTGDHPSTRVPLRPAPPVPINVCPSSHRRPKSAVVTTTVHSSLRRPRGGINTRRSLGNRTMSEFDSNSQITMESRKDAGAHGTENGGPSLQRTDSSSSLVDTKERNKEKRKLILMELTNTERDYVSDLQFCQNAFARNESEVKAMGIDTTIFGHLSPVIKVSRTFLSHLEKLTNQYSAEERVVAEAFQNVIEDIKKVYSDYCTNHDDVIQVLEKYDANPSTAEFIRKRLEANATKNFFDLGSILIKPVQRIMKYPLLIAELIKVVEDDNAEKCSLHAALVALTAAANTVNESKRRKELVQRYATKKDQDSGLSSRLSKLTIHSVVKKSHRIGMKVSSSLGLLSKTKDLGFDDMVLKFNDIDASIKQLLKNMDAFCKEVTSCVTMQFSLSENVADFYVEQRTQKDVDQYRTIQRNIINSIWPDCHKTIEKRVKVPLETLLRLYESPKKLISKRNDKLLDYDSSSQRLEKNKDVNKNRILREDMQLARNTYEAMNSQLLEEMPKLIDVSISIFLQCVGAFVTARKRFIGRTTALLLDLQEQMPNLGQTDDILGDFDRAQDRVLCSNRGSGLLPKDVQASPRPERSSRGQDKYPEKQLAESTQRKDKQSTQNSQSASQQAYLQGRYPADQLFQAGKAHPSTNPLELTLAPGDYVAVLKRMDPMGNTSRWFVDNGTEKGFVDHLCLIQNWLSSPPPEQQERISPVPAQSNAAKPPAKEKSQPTTKTKREQPRPAKEFPQPAKDVPHPELEMPPPYSECPPSAEYLATLSRRPKVTPVVMAPIAECSSYAATGGSSATVPSSSFAPLQQQQQLLSPENWLAPEPINNTSPSPQPHLYDYVADEDNSAAAEALQRRYMSSPFQGSAGHVTPPNASDNRYDIPNDFDLPDDLDDDLAGLAIGGPPTNFFDPLAQHQTRTSPTDASHAAQPVEEPKKAEFYLANFDFGARGPHELTMVRGQVVLVHHKHDLEHNPDWWYVEDRFGNFGYVPGNYIVPYRGA